MLTATLWITYYFRFNILCRTITSSLFILGFVNYGFPIVYGFKEEPISRDKISLPNNQDRVNGRKSVTKEPWVMSPRNRARSKMEEAASLWGQDWESKQMSAGEKGCMTLTAKPWGKSLTAWVMQITWGGLSMAWGLSPQPGAHPILKSIPLFFCVLNNLWVIRAP